LDLAKWTQQQGAMRDNAVAEGFAKAVEFVVTPLICGFVGHFLDGWLGTTPILTVVLVVWALAVTVGMTIKDYNARMRVEEEKLLGPKPKEAA
jgi:F0F1-type ATP synthase assembly protein I